MAVLATCRKAVRWVIPADEFGDAELRAKAEKPPLVQWGIGGAEQPPSIIPEYNATF